MSTLEGDLAGDGAASVFIDIINLPIARHHIAAPGTGTGPDTSYDACSARGLPCVMARVGISITIRTNAPLF
jgi:hypothetical protein